MKSTIPEACVVFISYRVAVAQGAADQPLNRKVSLITIMPRFFIRGPEHMKDINNGGKEYKGIEESSDAGE